MTTLPKRDCEQCGNEYTPRSARSRFCTHACHNRAWRARNRPERPDRPCDQCGTIFSPKNDKHRFCSNKCCAEFHPPVPAKPEPVEMVHCNWPPCGKLFKPTNGRAMYCSRPHRLRHWRQERQKAGPQLMIEIPADLLIYVPADKLPEEFWISVRCPQCGKPAGVRCRTPGGRTANHAARVDAVIAASTAVIAGDPDVLAAALAAVVQTTSLRLEGIA